MAAVAVARPFHPNTNNLKINRSGPWPNMSEGLGESHSRSTQQRVSTDQTIRHIAGVQEVQAILHAGRSISASMTEECNSPTQIAQDHNHDATTEPQGMTAMERRKQKRFTLTLPITANLNQFAPSGPPSPTRSTASSITPSEEATRPTTPSEPNFLTALAAQERRVLELRDGLAKAEQVLHKLKKEWAIHEVNKKRQDIRDSRKARNARHINNGNPGSSAASIKLEDGEPQLDAAAREAERRRAMHYQARTAQRTVFSGSKHARALSLLSPDPQQGEFTNSLSDAVESAATAPLKAHDGIQPVAVRAVPHQRVVSGEMQRSKSDHGRDGEIDIDREVLMRAGRQMASDFKDGLWTFLEDLRQVTVGEEVAGNSAAPRTRTHRPDLNSKVGTANKSPSGAGTRRASTSSPGRVQRTKRIAISRHTNTHNGDTAKKASPKDSAVDFDEEQDVVSKDLVDMNAPASPTSKRTPRRRSVTKSAAARQTPIRAEDIEPWDDWDSPQTAQKIPQAAPSIPAQVDAVMSVDGPLPGTDADGGGKREPIPWPALTKLPSNLRRTASHLMSEWEKSLSPQRQNTYSPRPEDHHFEGTTTVTVHKME